jgi:hypothetical protein
MAYFKSDAKPLRPQQKKMKFPNKRNIYVQSIHPRAAGIAVLFRTDRYDQSNRHAG